MNAQFPVPREPGDGDAVFVRAGEPESLPAVGVHGMTARIRKITTTDEGKLQVVMESEGMNDALLMQVKDMFTLQQTCAVHVSFTPLQRDLFDA